MASDLSAVRTKPAGPGGSALGGGPLTGSTPGSPLGPPHLSIGEPGFAELRRRAVADIGPGCDLAGMLALIDELENRQEELGRQNHALLLARAEVEASRGELEHSQERYQDLFQEAPVAYLTLDGQGRILQANRAAARMLEITPERLESGFLSRFVDPDHLGLVGAMRRECLLSGLKSSGPLLLRTAQGGELWVQAELVCMGEPPGETVICTLTDITELRQAQDKRRRLEEELQRTRRLDSLATLSGGVAHHFNNLLAAVLGYVDLALETGDMDPAVRGMLRQAHAAGGRATDLVKAMLTFARRGAARLEPLDLNYLVDTAVAAFRGRHPELWALETHLAPDLPRVAGDPQQLSLALDHLLDNARLAIGPLGRVAVETGVLGEAEALDEGEVSGGRGSGLHRPMVWLRVIDDGVGMDPVTRERCFEPFFSTREVGQGSGLGLSAVHGIVSEHGGRVFCASEPGRGTSMELLLPPLAPETDPADGA